MARNLSTRKEGEHVGRLMDHCDIMSRQHHRIEPAFRIMISRWKAAKIACRRKIPVEFRMTSPFKPTIYDIEKE